MIGPRPPVIFTGGSNDLSDLLDRVMYTGQRIVIIRNREPAAALLGLADLEALEAFESAEDVLAYREAKAAADERLLTLGELRNDLK